MEYTNYIFILTCVVLLILILINTGTTEKNVVNDLRMPPYTKQPIFLAAENFEDETLEILPLTYFELFDSVIEIGSDFTIEHYFDVESADTLVNSYDMNAGDKMEFVITNVGEERITLKFYNDSDGNYVGSSANTDGQHVASGSSYLYTLVVLSDTNDFATSQRNLTSGEFYDAYFTKPTVSVTRIELIPPS